MIGSVTFAREKLSVIRGEAWPLLLRHWDEIALNKATTPLDPDWETYQLLEDSGTFHVVTARVGGDLVGYVSFIVRRNLHYRSVIVAQDDIFYLAPEHRRGMLGMRLLAEADRVAIELGATRLIHHHKDHTDVGPLFRRMGFDLIEHTYAKTV